MSPDGETQTGPMAGGVVIFAAGNENSGQPGYPAAYEPCISVAAVSCTYEAAWYTNYGPTVDICAPGGGDAADFSRPIHYNEGYNLSTLPTDLQNGMTFVYTNFRGGGDPHDLLRLGDSRVWLHAGDLDGLPHVSGVAALIVSQFGAPGFTNEQLKEKLSRQHATSTAIRDQYTMVGDLCRKNRQARRCGCSPGFGRGAARFRPADDHASHRTERHLHARRLRTENAAIYAGRLHGMASGRPSGKIAKSIDGNVVTLTIDASQYAAGSYTAELLAVNGTKTAKRTIAYTVSEGDNPTGISMDFTPTHVPTY